MNRLVYLLYNLMQMGDDSGNFAEWSPIIEKGIKMAYLLYNLMEVGEHSRKFAELFPLIEKRE